MKYLLTRPRVYTSSGFTLLEMIVVLLLVSMLSGMLMQGFVYMSGVYSAVERRRSFAQSQRLLEGWLRNSIQGVVNGVDGQVGRDIQFEGEEFSLRGISFSPLVGQTSSSGYRVGGAHKIEWRLKKEGETLTLLYGEAPIAGNLKWYTVKTWLHSSASWRYWDDGQWIAEYPTVGRFDESEGGRLPAGVLLEVKGGREPFSMFVAMSNNSGRYRKPAIIGVF